MDEEERTRHLRRLRKRGVDSNFPAPPPLEFSRRCNGTCRKDRTVPIMPGEPGRGRMHVFPSLPPRRIAGCLEGPELEAARAEIEALSGYAKNLGLAYQITDDILDVTSTAEKLGKDAGQDHNRTTFISFCGLEEARVLVGDLVGTANRCLDPFGSRAERMRDLAAYIEKRQY